MMNKQELDLFKKNLLEKERNTQNISSQSWTYLLFSKGLPLLSPIILGMLAKKVNPKNKTLKFLLQKSILLGIPFIIKTFFRRK